MNEDGTESLLDGAAAQEVYAIWKELEEAGAVAPGAKDETGATWVAGFQEGKIGVMPYPATLLATADQTVDIGVVPIPGSDGGESTFVGGDGIGISKDSENAAQAWNFLSWLMSEEAQVQVLAKNSTYGPRRPRRERVLGEGPARPDRQRGRRRTGSRPRWRSTSSRRSTRRAVRG